MKLSLAKVSGLSDIDPLFHCLKVVDKILEKHYSWGEVHLKQPEETLLYLICSLGPINEDVILEKSNFYELADKLRELGEPILASLLVSLLERMDTRMIRITLMFVIVNLETFKVTEARLFKKEFRTLDAGWMIE
jgi:hypothetical protein